MITCTLNNQKYTIDFVSGRALREMEPAAKMYGRIVALSNAALKGETPSDAGELSIADAMDVMIRWFCILFGNQFNPDDVLDYAPCVSTQTLIKGFLDLMHGDNLASFCLFLIFYEDFPFLTFT